jgi:hypothetical protein
VSEREQVEDGLDQEAARPTSDTEGHCTVRVVTKRCWEQVSKDQCDEYWQWMATEKARK